MRKSLLKSIFVMAFIAITYNSFGQSDTLKNMIADSVLNIKAEKKASFKIGANYTSNNVFMGRTGINNIPIISPDIKYTFKSGLYFSGDMNILPKNKTNVVDGGSLTAGYDLDITDDLDAGISYSKMFYSTNSSLVGSSITNIFSLNIDYTLGDIITPGVTAEYAVNSGAAPNDVIANASIAHDFIAEKIFGDKDVFIISPTVGANFGTQNFYDAYIQRKVFKSAKVSDAVAKFENGLNQFKILDYELSAPLEYKIKHLIFEFTPTYSIVENGFKSATLEKAVGLSDKTSVFYFETGLALKF